MTDDPEAIERLRLSRELHKTALAVLHWLLTPKGDHPSLLELHRMCSIAEKIERSVTDDDQPALDLNAILMQTTEDIRSHVDARIDQLMRERAARADPDEVQRVLDRIQDVPPAPGDEMPEDPAEQARQLFDDAVREIAPHFKDVELPDEVQLIVERADHSRTPDETPAEYAERMRHSVTIIISRVRIELGDPGYEMDDVIEEMDAIVEGGRDYIFADRLRSALAEAKEQLGFEGAWAIIGPWMMRERAAHADPEEVQRVLDQIDDLPPEPGDEMPEPKTVYDILMAWYARDLTNAEAHRMLELDGDETVEEVAKDNGIFGWGWKPGGADEGP